MISNKLNLNRLALLGGGSGPSAIVPGLADTLPAGASVDVVIGTHDGGSSSGKLRKIFGGPAVGDLRKNLSAASTSEIALLFENRFGPDATLSDVERLTERLLVSLTRRGVDDSDVRAIHERIVEVSLKLDNMPSARLGKLAGHVYGNLVLTAIRLHFGGDMIRAARAANEWFEATAEIIPVSGDEHDLVMNDGKAEVWGEGLIDEHRVHDPKSTKVWLEPVPLATPAARRAIAGATTIIVGPGSVFTSLMPLLYVRGVAEAIREQGRSGGALVYVANLLEERHATRGLTVADQLAMMEARIGRQFDLVAYNQRTYGLPHGTSPQLLGEADIADGTWVAKADLVNDHRPEADPNDAIAHLRSTVNHDGKKLGTLLSTFMIAKPVSRAVFLVAKR